MAQEWLPLLATLARGRLVPIDAIVRGRQLAEKLSARRRLLTWQEGLVRAFEEFASGTLPERYQPFGPLADLNSIGVIEEALRAHVGDDVALRVPSRFLKQTPAVIRAAVKALKAMKVVRPGQRPGGRAGPITAYAAAQLYAEALGLRFTERRADIGRTPKTDRRVSQRTKRVSKRSTTASSSSHDSSSNARGDRSSR